MPTRHCPRLARPFLLLLFLLPVANLACTGKPPGYPYQVQSTYGVDDPQFARTMGQLLGPPLDDGNTITPLQNGDQIFPAMLEAIRAAKVSITFETFIYWRGEVAKQFTDALVDRAKNGVKVHILIDPIGSDKLDKAHIRALTDAGAQVNLYHALKWYDWSSAARLNNRTHRKLLVVDGRVGFTGGVGIADEWSGDAHDAHHYRDCHYRLTGPAVGHLQAAFADNWVETTSRVIQGDDYFPELKATGKQFAQVFKSSSKGGGSESMQLMFLMSFAAAKSHIRLGTAYFVPDPVTLRALVDARKRGVRVQVMIPGPHTDVPATRNASRAMWGELLEAGVEIYEYQPTMYHCKVMVVDDRWTSIGSTNLDNRSFRLNAEANLNVLDPAFAAGEAKTFDNDLARARKITYEEWAHRPFLERVKEGAATLLKWQL